MQNKIWNNIRYVKNYYLRILVIIVIIFSLTSIYLNFTSNIDLNHDIPNEKFPNLNSFNKENYTEVLTTDKHGLGNITIDDIKYNAIFPGLVNENVYHPLVTEDLIEGSLSINTTEMEFIETTNPALVDNLDVGTNDRTTARYKFNETLQVKYNKTKARYLVYHSRFVNSKLLELYVNNGTIITELIEDVDYTIDNQNYIVFYYEDYFQVGRTFNFTIYLIWENLIAFGNWDIEQKEDQFLKLNELEQEFIVNFNYNFFMVARAYGLNLEEAIEITFWDVALTVNPLDKELFNDHELTLNGIKVDIGEHLNPDKSIQIKLSDAFTPESSVFSLNFTTSYILRLDEPLGSFWAVDRLVNMRTIRERIYLCNLISGPTHIYLKDVFFYESAIYFEETVDSYSLFNRYVAITEININISGYLGLNITIPYLFVGETCPVIVKYYTLQKLKIVITDNIKMPIVGAKIEILHFGAPYGTYISNTTSQPIIPRKSDENGQIILNNVPRGNYTIRVYYQGAFVKEAKISTFKEINYVYTTIPHSAFWIIIFGTFNGFILIIGSILYLKYRKLR